MRRLIFSPTTHHFPFKSNRTFLCPSVSKKPPRWPHMTITTTASASASVATGNHRNKKIVVILGPTGSGKSKLSVDLSSRFFTSSEIINSDKIQVYSGLDITTNKIPLHERENVPHHLLGEFHPSDSHPEFTPSDYRLHGGATISKVLSRRNIPIVVGGSNSFIYALLAEKFNPEIDVFSESDSINSVFCKQLRYNCCFLWMDVSLPILNQYLRRRVDEMLDSGMLDELAEYFNDRDSDSVNQSGLRKAIGVPEFETYFKRIKKNEKMGDDLENRGEYEEAVKAVKDNTCQLAKRQLGKILRLRDAAGWEVQRIDATAAFTARLAGKRVADIWERQVVETSVKIVNRFLME